MRAKAKAESTALHAGLRKEQMKVESLERALQQKVTPGSLCCPEHPLGARGILWVWGLESALWVWFLGGFLHWLPWFVPWDWVCLLRCTTAPSPWRALSSAWV